MSLLCGSESRSRTEYLIPTEQNLVSDQTSLSQTARLKAKICSGPWSPFRTAQLSWKTRDQTTRLTSCLLMLRPLSDSQYKCHASFIADNDMDKTLRQTPLWNSSSKTCSFLSLQSDIMQLHERFNTAFRQVSRLSSLIFAFTCGQPFDSLIDGISLYRYVHV